MRRMQMDAEGISWRKVGFEEQEAVFASPFSSFCPLEGLGVGSHVVGSKNKEHRTIQKEEQVG